MFQFPSNGKAYPKSESTEDPGVLWRLVSIPFKRESLSKAECKCHGKSKKHSTVSIPFKRESLSKGYHMGQR